jgi:hypothetical protein
MALWQGPGHLGNTWLIIMGCLLGAVLFTCFSAGYLGCDALELREFKDAVEIVLHPFRALVLLAYQLVSVGSVLSPLYDRFPAKLGSTIAEAGVLIAREVRLD